MLTRILFVPLVCALIARGPWCAEEAPPADAAQIRKWAVELGDEDLNKRNAAQENLRLAGESARAQVEEAAQSTDAEVQLRAKRLLSRMNTDPLLGRVAAALAQLKSLQGDVLCAGKMPNFQLELRGTLKTLADATHFHMEVTSAIGAAATHYTVVGDGKTQWTEVSMAQLKNRKWAYKHTLELLEKSGGFCANPLTSFKQLCADFDFKTVSDGKCGETDVFVLAGKLKAGRACPQYIMISMAQAPLGEASGCRIHVGKQDLLPRKFECLDGDDVVTSTELSGLKINDPLDDNIFKYVPPTGVTVIDGDAQIKTK